MVSIALADLAIIAAVGVITLDPFSTANVTFYNLEAVLVKLPNFSAVILIFAAIFPA
jgi:hypothetical protein|nr:MAG TPA: hypothetical protein [Caudoviricetes sp.]